MSIEVKVVKVNQNSENDLEELNSDLLDGWVVNSTNVLQGFRTGDRSYSPGQIHYVLKRYTKQ